MAPVQKDPAVATQDEVLESFVNVQHYDMLLTHLESTLFHNAPRFYCPSAFFLDVLFTLATLSEYNNADLLRKEMGNPSSERPVCVRAVAVLQGIVSVVKNGLDSKGDEGTDDNPFAPVKYNTADLEYAREELFKSVRFLKRDHNKELRSRALKKKDYVDKAAPAPQLQNQQEQTSTLKDQLDDDLELSPQKRALQRAMASLGQLSDDENEDSDELKTTADKNSFHILKNERFDSAMDVENIWTAIAWAFKCSNSQSPVKQEVWKMWEPILNIIFDILDLELKTFTTTDDDDDDEVRLFSDTLTHKFLIKPGRFNWAKKIVEFLFPLDEAHQIFPNELDVAKSVHLIPMMKNQLWTKMISVQSLSLRKKLFHLAIRWCSLVTKYDSEVTITRASPIDLITETGFKILKNGEYEDLVRWFQLQQAELEDIEVVNLYVETITAVLTQITTSPIVKDINERWFLDPEASETMEELLDITYQKKYYNIDDPVEWKRMQTDFNVMNFCLLMYFRFWTQYSKVKLTTKQKKTILDLASKGEAKRLQVLQSIKKERTVELNSVHGWLQKLIG